MRSSLIGSPLTQSAATDELMISHREPREINPEAE